MKNILVTGGCGFIASNFLNYMIKKYDRYNFINLDAMYYCANEKNITKSNRNKKNYKFIKGTIQNKELVDFILTENKIDTIVHFAAQSHVDNSFSNPIQYTKDNILGTHILLESVRKYGKIEKFIHVSTDEVYGESLCQETDIKNEKSLLNPTNPYAATKASAEMLVNSYVYSYGLPVIITRGNNVYGPRQYPEKLIPKFIMHLLNNEKVTIQGNGSCVRAFLHSYDVARAFELILEKGKIGEIYNIGSDEDSEYLVLDVAKLLIKLIKNENYDNWITYIEDRPFNDKRYYISNQKMKDLGWDIKISFDEGIKSLISSINNFEKDTN